MPTTMLKYYFLKDLLNELPDGIKDVSSIDKNIILDASTLIDAPSFYLMFNPFKKDKYKLDLKLNSDKFMPFIYDCIQNFKKNPTNEKLILIYGLITSYVLNKNIIPYINAKLPPYMDFFTATNMIDFYYAKVKGLDLSKVDLTYEFQDGFIYRDEFEEIINRPLIKNFNFLSSKTYFIKAYKDEWIYYSYFTRSRFKIKFAILKIYDLIFSHRKGKQKLSRSIIKNKIDTKILNLTKQRYIINDKEYFNSLDELIKKAHNEAFGLLTIVNNYLFYNMEIEFNNTFNSENIKE